MELSNGPRTKISEPLGNFPNILQPEVYVNGSCAQLNMIGTTKIERLKSDSQVAVLALSSYSIKSKIIWKLR